jgi:hypothetical protein
MSYARYGVRINQIKSNQSVKFKGTSQLAIAAQLYLIQQQGLYIKVTFLCGRMLEKII